MSPKKIESFSRNSYAKINLYLDVLGLLPDGYHEIRTIFTEIEVADVLKYTLTGSKNIEILTNVEAISNQDNLVVKIASFLQEKYCIDRGVSIVLDKHIPLAAGLGGGSSNAATTIQVLSDLWDLNLSDSEMHEIATMFGSDVPYFLLGGTALGTHKGEKLDALSPFSWDQILLVKPKFGISAREAYSIVQYGENATSWEQLISTGNVRCCFNRLQRGIVGNYPVIGQIITELGELGAIKAMMTGSGSTCVGFFDDPISIQKAKTSFEQKGYWTCCTKTRSQSTMNVDKDE
jgi:4-diphosphocytidyl-2-C-methyl-D-erythritol kinase